MQYPWRNIAVVEGEDAYYGVMGATTIADPDADCAYEKTYGVFEEAVRQLFVQRFGIPAAEQDFFDDWVPNRTREADVSEASITAEVVAAVYELIIDRWRGWRFMLNLSRSIESGDRSGAIAIHHDWLLCWGRGERVAREFVDLMWSRRNA